MHKKSTHKNKKQNTAKRIRKTKNVFLLRPSACQCVGAKEDEVPEGADGRQGGGICIHRTHHYKTFAFCGWVLF